MRPKWKCGTLFIPDVEYNFPNFLSFEIIFCFVNYNLMIICVILKKKGGIEYFTKFFF